MLPISDEVKATVRELYLQIDETTGDPALTQADICDRVVKDFDVKLGRSTIATWVREGRWRSLRDVVQARVRESAIRKVVTPAAQRDSVNEAVEFVEKGTDVLKYAKTYTDLLAKVTERAAHGLGGYLARHLEAWVILEKYRRRELQLQTARLNELRGHLLKPGELCRILALGGNLANNNILQVFISQYQATVETTNFYTWLDGGPEPPEAPPPMHAGGGNGSGEPFDPSLLSLTEPPTDEEE